MNSGDNILSTKVNSGQIKVSIVDDKSLLSPNNIKKSTLGVETRSEIGFKGLKIGVGGSGNNNDW